MIIGIDMYEWLFTVAIGLFSQEPLTFLQEFVDGWCLLTTIQHLQPWTIRWWKVMTHFSFVCVFKGTWVSSELLFIMKRSTWHFLYHRYAHMTIHNQFEPCTYKGGWYRNISISRNAPARTASFREMDNWKVTV